MRQISTLEPTRYEIAAKHADGRAVLIAYTCRKSRHGLLACMRDHGERLIALCEIGEADQIAFKASPRAHATVKDWVIGFTGRTQRDCRNEGELPFIAA